MAMSDYLLAVLGALAVVAGMRVMGWFDERRWRRERADEDAAGKAAE